jgi:DNA-binding GntR family transcriptional regulator
LAEKLVSDGLALIVALRGFFVRDPSANRIHPTLRADGRLRDPD